MKRVIGLIGLCAMAVVAAATPFHVKSITYQGKDVISGTFTFPTKFTVHQDDRFTLGVDGAAGTKLEVDAIFQPAMNWATGPAGPGQPLGKPVEYTIPKSGHLALVWHVAKAAKVGVHGLKLHPQGSDEPTWTGYFIVTK